MLHQSVAEKDPYTVAIIDLQKPETDGLSLVGKINADPLLRRTRTILLTPYGKPISGRRIENHGSCCLLQSNRYANPRFSIVSSKSSLALRM